MDMNDAATPATARRCRRLRRVITAAALLLVAPLAACVPIGFAGPSFAVGDCVEVDQQLLSTYLTSAPCHERARSSEPPSRTYRVDSITHQVMGSCPTQAGRAPVDFSYQPDGVTYCLVRADGS